MRFSESGSPRQEESAKIGSGAHGKLGLDLEREWLYLEPRLVWLGAACGCRKKLDSEIRQPGVKAIIYLSTDSLGQSTDLLSLISLFIKLEGYQLYLSPGFQSLYF